MKDFLYLIIAIVVVAVAISLIIHADPQLTTNWVFWVGVILVLGIFLGVPTGILALSKNL